MRRIAGGVAGFFVIVLAACVGDDPNFTASSSGTSGTSGTSGSPAGGVACSATTPCAAGTCVDGYCCDSACSGTCEACNVAGQEGKCVAVSGAPKHGKCDGDATGACAGSCDGANRAACNYPKVACGAASSCAADIVKPAGTCNAGTCQAGVTQTCALGCSGDTCLGVKQVAANRGSTCVVLTDKHVRCWGVNSLGETGHTASATPIPTPLEITGFTDVESIAANGSAFCAVKTDKTVWCWGGNTSGQLGNGTVDPTGAVTPHATPAQVPGLTGVTFIAGGSGSHFCAIVGAAGEVKCWGANGSGQIGDNTTGGNRPSPTSICAPDAATCPTTSSKATFLALGDNYTCGIFDGNVACWGANGGAQLGQATPPNVNPKPTKISPALPATYLTAGNSLSCAATAGGAKCWGNNFGTGRLGHGVADSNYSAVPVTVCTKADCTTLLTGVTGLSTYDESVCGLAAGGAVKCWGSNTGGQLGDGTIVSQAFAATTAIAAGAVAITSGGGANYAIVVDGANRDLRCWGQESDSQCGTGTFTADRLVPVAPKW